MREKALASQPIGQDEADRFGAGGRVVLLSPPRVDRGHLISREPHREGRRKCASGRPAFDFLFYSR